MCINLNAFGNALGSSLAEASSSVEEKKPQKSFSEQVKDNLARNTPEWLKLYRAENGSLNAGDQAAYDRNARFYRTVGSGDESVAQQALNQTVLRQINMPELGMNGVPTQILAGSVSRGYTDMYSLGWRGTGEQVIGVTYHRTADDRLEGLQNRMNDFFVNDPDAVAVSGSDGMRQFAAATYGVRKITADTAGGILGIPRMLTSQDQLPGLVHAAAHPLDTAQNMMQAFNRMSVQDRWVTGLEVALPFKGNVEYLAGKAGDYAATGAKWAAREFGPQLDRMAHSYMTRNGMIMNVMPDGPGFGGANGAPVSFANRVLNEAFSIEPVPLLSPEQALRTPGKILYVVKEDGSLVIARTNSDNLFGHFDLAKGENILAGGEGRIYSGQVKTLDNASGHYLPEGQSARDAAVNAFRNAGFIVPETAYIEKVYDFKLGKWVPK